MKLSEYGFKEISFDHNVSKICDNSKECIKDSIFVSFNSINQQEYINEAIKNGSKTIICEKEIDKRIKNINYIKVKSVKVAIARLLKHHYKEFSCPKMIAVTGTNGKTSTTSFVYQILKVCHKNVLLFGTEGIFSYVDDVENIYETKNTTPRLSLIYDLMFSKLYDVVIMEASSEGIMEGRILGLCYDVVCFTNITQDHFNYHKNFDNYFFSKAKLISQINDNGVLLLNDKITNLDVLLNYSLANVKIYGNSEKDYNIRLIENTNFHSIIEIKVNNSLYYTKTKIIGDFNLDNIIASIAILDNIGITLSKIIASVKYLENIKGRMSLYLYHDAYIFIDFAHTPDALLKVLKYLNKIKSNNLYTIIGCGGCKDIEKRPKMGNIATKYSDYVIFTEDNSRSEETINIINDMVNKLVNKNFDIIINRKDAIDKAISLLNKGDILAILGKGTEKYIIRKEKIKFCDIDYITNKEGVKKIE